MLQRPVRRQSVQNVCWRCSIRFEQQQEVSTSRSIHQVQKRTISSHGQDLPKLYPYPTASAPKSLQVSNDEKSLGRQRGTIPPNHEAPKYTARPSKNQATSSTLHSRLGIVSPSPTQAREELTRALGGKHHGAEGFHKRWEGRYSFFQHYAQDCLHNSKGSTSRIKPQGLEDTPPFLLASVVSASFGEQVLHSVDREVKAVHAAEQQKLYGRPLHSGARHNPTTSNKSLSSRLSQPAIPRGLSVTLSKRYFSSVNRSLAELSVSQTAKDASPIFQTPQSPKPVLRGKVREYLASWQASENEKILQAEPSFGVSPTSSPVTSAGQLTAGLAGTAVNETEDFDDSELTEFDTDVASADTTMKSLDPGDLFEIIHENRCILAIVVRRFPNQNQLLSQHGLVIHTSATFKFYYRISGFCSRLELSKILPYLPSEELPPERLLQFNATMMHVPQQAAEPLLRRMEDFSRHADAVYRENADKIDNAHKLLAHEKEFRWMHIKEITARVLRLEATKDIPDYTVWAVHRAIILYDMGFLPDVALHWRKGIFEILSRQDMDLVTQIRHWVREHQEYAISKAQATEKTAGGYGRKTSVLAEFAKNIRPIIEKSRALRPSTPWGDVGSSVVKVEPNPLSFRNVPLRAAEPSESLILRFLEMWSARNSAREGSPLWALGPLILRSTGVYDDQNIEELNVSTGFNFLKEAGVVAPWENRTIFHSRLALPGLNFDLKTDKLLTDAAKSANAYELIDKMEHLRSDWGSLEVFCIDAHGTQEVDDGVSVETIQGDSSVCWIHVHIANPTAFIPPDHAMAAYAEQIAQSIYFPGKTYSMLPPKITQEHFSLAAGRPVLSFSAKLNDEGEILETRITPSRIHNVIYVTPDTILERLAARDPQSATRRTHTVGYAPPLISSEDNKKFSRSLTTTQAQQLELLYRFARAQRRQGFMKMIRAPEEQLLAMQDYAQSWSERPQTLVYYSQMEFPWRRVLRRVEGDPTIRLITNVPDQKVNREAWSNETSISEGLSVSKMLVQSLMVLAGEVAASWCAARGITTIFRGTSDSDTTIAPELRERWIKASQPEQPPEPMLFCSKQYVRASFKGVISNKAIPHRAVGAQAYCKVTSPLRRYGDMATHWQIEAALRLEAKLGRPLTELDHPDLPFSKAKTAALMTRTWQREQIIARSQLTADTAWCALLLARGYHFHEPIYPDPLPEYWEISIEVEFESYWFGRIRELDYGCLIVKHKIARGIGTVAAGDRWKMKIISAEPARIEGELVELVAKLL